MFDTGVMKKHFSEKLSKLPELNSVPGVDGDPKDVGASIVVEGDDSLSASLLAEEDEPLISPLPPGSAGFGTVEPVSSVPAKEHFRMFAEYGLTLQ